MASSAFLTKAYLAYFGRPVDTNGAINYGTAAVTEKQILDNFSTSAESKALYPTFGLKQIADIYMTLFGREAELGGAAHWAALLADGRETPASLAMAILNGAQGADLATLNNKIAASAAFTTNLDTMAEALGYSGAAAASSARDFLATVKATPASSVAVVAAVAGSVTAGTTAAVVTSSLTTGQDNLVGSAGNDVFTGSIFDNSNTLQSGDKITGGAGVDRLVVDIGNSQRFAITPETTGVEQIAIRAQAIGVDSNNNNMVDNSTSGALIASSNGATGNQVQIDAERMVGVTQFESNNSRADVVIEDVRILSSQITKDITIAMVETDAGHVDMGVYFDQYSLRNVSTTSATLTLQVMDTRSNAAGTAPLKDSPYNGFAFYYTAAGATEAKLITVTSAAIDAAQTYAELLTAVTAAVKLVPELATFTVALGSAFSVSDTLGAIQTGTNLVLTSSNGTVASTGVGAGWLAAGAVPASSGLHTNMSTAVVASTDLVTSKIILDDVGRGSTGGDLVVGGLSVGSTSSSSGVQRFEIEVRDNSKLESINSTNNTLREVTIVNGKTTSSAFAYVTSTTDKGDLTVNGFAGTNGANVTTGLATFDFLNENAPLPGSTAQTANGFGFSDVRLIDASAMTGKLAFSAEITSASIAKYMTLTDSGAAAADNIAVTYTGGSNADTMFIQLDGSATASRSTLVAGREDFTFTANGGDGNDTITVAVVNGLLGQASDWYNNQDLNNNININGGAGNDTIKTPGAGDTTIDAGAGNDVVYTDNTGSLAFVATASTGTTGTAAVNATTKGAWVLNTFDQANASTNVIAMAARDLNDLRSDSNESYNLFKATLTVDFKGFTSAKITIDSTGYKTTDLQINQAIKAAINADPVLKALLVAKDGPSGSLIVESLIDGVMSTTDLTVAVVLPLTATLSQSELDAAKVIYGSATTSFADVTASMTTALGVFTANGDYVDQLATDSTKDLAGAASTSTSDNFITLGAGDDIVVLGTTVGGVKASSSNEVLVYTAGFGNDTVVNFAATGMGADYINLNAFLTASVPATATTAAVIAATVTVNTGYALTDNAITVLALNVTPLAAARNDSAAEIKRIVDLGGANTVVLKQLVAVQDATNIGKASIYSVVNGIALNDAVVTLEGSIDLGSANAWTALTAASFIAPSVYADGGATFGFVYTATDIGQTIVGSNNADSMNTSTFTGVTMTGGAANDLFNVTATGAIISDLTTGDQLVVSTAGGVTATTAAFTATVASSNAAANAAVVLTAAATGGVINMLAATGTTGYSLVGGIAADTLTGSTFNDIITGGAGANTLTGAGGADSFVMVATGVVPSATSFQTITDYSKAAGAPTFDTISAATLIMGTQGTTAAAGVAAISTGGVATFNVADTTFAAHLTAVAAALSNTAGETAVWQEGLNTYMYISDGAAGVAATDTLIQLTGVTAGALTIGANAISAMA